MKSTSQTKNFYIFFYLYINFKVHFYVFPEGTPSEWNMQKYLNMKILFFREIDFGEIQVNLILHMKIINRLENKPYVND